MFDGTVFDGTGHFGFVTVARLNLLPQFFSRIFRIQLGQLPQQFFGSLVAWHGPGDGDLDNLVPAHAVLRGRRHALLA